MIVLILLMLLAPEERRNAALQGTIWLATRANFTIIKAALLFLDETILMLRVPKDYLAKVLHVGLLLLQL